MKKLIIITLALIGGLPFLHAQDSYEALKFSRYQYYGTARSSGMGNAFGALGADFSAVSINPAGLGVYRKGEFAFTPSLKINRNTGTYMGQSMEDENFKFQLDNIHFVSTYNTNRNNGLVSLSFGVGYNRLADFSESITLLGRNAQTSMLDEFADNSSGFTNVAPSEFYEDLAWNADLMYIRDTEEDPVVYTHDMMSQGVYGQSQEHIITRSGGLGEYNFALGANVSHKLYFGLSVGIVSLSYDETIVHTETDIANNVDFFDGFSFTEDYLTSGTGVNMKLGIIARPLTSLRVGASVHLPTFYNIDTEFSTRMNGFFDPSPDFDDETFVRSDLLISEYRLTTPFRFIGSLGYQIGKVATISADYEYVDYGANRFDIDTDPTYQADLNDELEDVYNVAHNLRAGAEVRLGKVYLRHGWAFYQDPSVSLEDADLIDKTNVRATGGLGFRTRGFFMDFAYMRTMNDYSYFPYAYSTEAMIENRKNNFLLTMGFRF